MSSTITVTQLRTSLRKVVARVRRWNRITVTYRGRPAFLIVPVVGAPGRAGRLVENPLYRARALGRSTDGLTAADHDLILYGWKRPQGS